MSLGARGATQILRHYQGFTYSFRNGFQRPLSSGFAFVCFS